MTIGRDPVLELQELVLARWPDIASEPFNAGSLQRRLPDLDIHDGDPITWELVERVREAIDRAR